jgi:hypothetical protein
MIGYVAAGHKAIPPETEKPPAYPVDRDHQTNDPKKKGRRRWVETPVGLRPPCVPTQRHSHLD